MGDAVDAALEAPSFLDPILVDETRAGGEPVIEVADDGAILVSGHAGTTHYNLENGGVDPDFATPYTTQTYIWRSTDGGRTWDYVGLPEADVGPHGPGQGFSDPDFAIDAAGNLYHTELYLAQASVSKSSDDGRTWLQGNPAASHLPIVDRQWIAAGAEDTVYLSFNQLPTGHVVMKSTDGGLTFPQHTYVDGGAGPLYVDEDTGTVYEHGFGDGRYSLHVSTDGGQSFDEHTIAEGREFSGIFADLTLDEAGNVYATWQEANPRGGQSIFVAASTDQGETWTSPERVSPGNGSYIWPRVTAGDEGRVFVTWIGADETGNPDTMDASWHVDVAQSVDAHQADASWTRTRATDDPIHQGSICQSGTACQVEGGDRRLGDLFDATVGPEGRLLVTYPTTTMTEGGEAIAHPGFLKQSTGLSAYDDVEDLTPLLQRHDG